MRPGCCWVSLDPDGLAAALYQVQKDIIYYHIMASPAYITALLLIYHYYTKYNVIYCVFMIEYL